MSEWADEFFYLPAKGNAIPGKYKTSRTPYQRDMLDDDIDPTVIEYFWIIAKQMGKTLCFLIQNGYFMDQEPSSILMVYPAIEDAKAFARDKLMPAVRATPRLKGKIASKRKRDAGNNIRHKEFPGGEIDIAGSNSPSTLRQRSKRIVKCDEIDAYKPNKEGDPVEQADGRAETFHNAVKGKASTPGIKNVSRVEAGFLRSDKQYWFCPCPKCKTWQTLKWSQVKWEFEQPNGGVVSDPEKAVYVCESCHSHLSDADRIDMVLGGEWRATAPFKGRRGRHLSGLYRVIGKKKAFKTYLHEFVEGFLEAKRKGSSAQMVWVNTFLAETWQEEGEQPSASPLLERCEVYSDSLLPAQALVLVAGVDVQKDRIEMETVGFGIGEESWGIRYDTFMGKPLLSAVWDQLDAALKREFNHPSGAKLKIECACIDTGHLTDEVYKFVRPRQGRMVFATKGSAVPASPLVSMAKKSGVRKVKLHMIGTDTAKSLIYQRLKLETPGPGFMHFPIGYTLDYFNGLTAERMVTEYRRGFPINVWKCFPDGARNEQLDIRVGAQAALKILNVTDWSFQQLAKNLAIAPADAISKPNAETEPKAEVASDQTAVPPIKRPFSGRKSWVNRY